MSYDTPAEPGARGRHIFKPCTIFHHIVSVPIVIRQSLMEKPPNQVVYQ